ncbi:MAG: hypothetical protein ISR59_11290 [Anaerolineales bacterium]|uniref:Uncharacterized protein n=1 Tax=Candidatus Desulfolinea nitratireducens TaxID=2841698 RepID=A0A8J6TGZ3_9CHLR|nr:hypothetical protein [Candidatus Desulfolinea nitratireducens]MBL6961685.1 hypothetical protein [Anaerolineales bacterium]
MLADPQHLANGNPVSGENTDYAVVQLMGHSSPPRAMVDGDIIRENRSTGKIFPCSIIANLLFNNSIHHSGYLVI